VADPALTLHEPVTQAPAPAEPIGEPSLLIDAEDLARLLSVSLRHVRRMDSADELPRPLRLGGSVRWRAEEIRRWVESGCPVRKLWDAMQRRQR
jgi:predicted DNA-binding transcriptional regulator AlpA